MQMMIVLVFSISIFNFNFNFVLFFENQAASDSIPVAVLTTDSSFDC